MCVRWFKLGKNHTNCQTKFYSHHCQTICTDHSQGCTFQWSTRGISQRSAAHFLMAVKSPQVPFSEVVWGIRSPLSHSLSDRHWCFILQGLPLQAVFIDIWFLIWLEGYALLDNSALKYFWECQHKVLYGKTVSRSSLGPPGNPKKNTFLRRHFRFYSKFKVYWEMAWVQWAETWPIKFSIYCKKQSLTRGVGQAFSLST